MTEEKRKRISVRVIETKGESALVEWDGKRGYVPSTAVKDGSVSPTALGKAIPYGVPWERLDEALAKELRANGIWTKGDLGRNANRAWGIGKGYGMNLGDLNGFAHKEG